MYANNSNRIRKSKSNSILINLRVALSSDYGNHICYYRQVKEQEEIT